jgi:hypothetical protein
MKTWQNRKKSGASKNAEEKSIMVKAIENERKSVMAIINNVMKYTSIMAKISAKAK